jgi:hypothetical protein
MTSESTIKVRRVSLGSEHEDQKWLVLEGYIETCPQVTKRRTINTSALADGSLTLAGEKAKLEADVAEYHARWLAVNEALKDL